MEPTKYIKELTITTADLQRGLGLVQGAAERKATIPILGTVRLCGANGNLILTATDLDTTVLATVPADGEIDLCLPAKVLYDIVRLLNGGTVEIGQTANGRAVIRSGKAKFTLGGTPPSEFPTVALPHGEPLTLDGASFARAVRRVSHAITNEPGRFTLSGAQFELLDGRAKLVTTDGHRLAFAEFVVDSPETINLLIPQKALREAAKLFGDKEVALNWDANTILFQTDGLLLSARKLTGSFPDYQKILPKNPSCSTSFEVAEAVSVLRRASVLADGKGNRADLSVFKDEIHIAVRDGQGNEAREAFTAQSEGIGESVNAAFNADYLLDALGAAESDRVTVRFTDSNNPWLFTSDSDWTAIVMPQRF